MRHVTLFFDRSIYMKCYVTGAGGMVGSHLIELLAKKGFDTFGSFYHPTVDVSNINLRDVHFFELDIREHDKVFKFLERERPQVIYHLAAQSFPVASWKDPYYTMDVNVNGMVGIFESIRKVQELDKEYNPVIVVITSSAIYGEALLEYDVDNLPDESCRMKPLHPYGVSKAAEDLLCYQYFKNYGLKAIRVRLFNCTGPRKIGDISSDFARRAVELKRKGDNKLIVGNLTALRAILDARDLCEGLLLLAEKGVPGEAYNICSSHIFKMTHVVDCLEKIMGVKYDLIADPKLFRPADEALYAGNCDKIKSLGWVEKYQYYDTLKDIVEFWMKKD